MSAAVKTIPKSKAKTAYGLLSEICDLIIAEPKRYNQTRFLAVQGGDERPPMGFPSCGTVGCVAGWVVALKDRRAIKYTDVEGVASSVLGLVDTQKYQLFSGNALNNNNGHGPDPQTKQHARAGVKHIRRFQAKYRAQLLKKKV